MKKLLILSANPINTDKLRLDKEVREIQAALERSRSREEFQLITKWAVRINDLRRALLDNQPQIVHFSGHGVRTGNASLSNNQEQTHQREAVRLHSQPSGIALEDDFGQVKLVSTKALTDLFELFKDNVECVLLNACYSETQSNAIYQHIDCVIGMERAITDNAAINFSIGFYDAIGAGRNYADAFQFGCNNLDLNGIPESLTPKIKSRNNPKTLFLPNSKEKNMSGDRTINTGGGNYNERIGRDYVQGNYNAGGFSVGGSVGGNVNNVQGDKNRTIQGDNNQGVLGDNNQVTQQNQVGGDASLTKDDVVNLLAELEALVKTAELPAETKEEVIEDLSSAKKATDKEEPNKNLALKRLGSVAETLEKTSKTVDAGQKLWNTTKPIIVKVASWLGAAAGSHLLGL